jgi:hypothetical protein
MRYGGNTSCVSMRSGDQPPIVFDLGTGLRYFGASWPSDHPFDGTALVTHLHWDHVQGLPFFVPLLRDGAHLDVYAPAQEDGRSVHEAFDAFLRPPYFPVTLEHLVKAGLCANMRSECLRSRKKLFMAALVDCWTPAEPLWTCAGPGGGPGTPSGPEFYSALYNRSAMKRRDFLYRTGMTTAGFALGGRARPLAQSEPSRWRTFEITTHVHVQKPDGKVKLVSPAALSKSGNRRGS